MNYALWIIALAPMLGAVAEASPAEIKKCREYYTKEIDRLDGLARHRSTQQLRNARQHAMERRAHCAKNWKLPPY